MCLIGPENPIGLHVVRQIGPDGIILAWKSPQPNTISSFEVGRFRIRVPGQTDTFDRNPSFGEWWGGVCGKNVDG